MLAEHEVERALVIVAHPDDAEFWAGGTIAHWTDTGITVTYCVLTDGEAGGYDASVPRDEIPHIRRAEQQKAAATLGVKDVHFLGLAEGELRSSDLHLRRKLVRIIRLVRPQRIITWSPEWNWQRFRSCHPDHRTSGEIVLSAIYPDAGNQFAHLSLGDEGLEAWTVREAWLLNSPHVNHYVDITETFERKVSTVRLHTVRARQAIGRIYPRNYVNESPRTRQRRNYRRIGWLRDSKLSSPASRCYFGVIC